MESEGRKTKMIFLKTCDINVLENAWIYRLDAWLHHADASNQYFLL